MTPVLEAVLSHWLLADPDGMHGNWCTGVVAGCLRDKSPSPIRRSCIALTLVHFPKGGHKDLHTRYFFNVKNERMWLEGGR